MSAKWEVRWSHDCEDMRLCIRQHLRNGGEERERELFCLCPRIASADNFKGCKPPIGGKTDSPLGLPKSGYRNPIRQDTSPMRLIGLSGLAVIIKQLKWDCCVLHSLCRLEFIRFGGE